MGLRWQQSPGLAGLLDEVVTGKICPAPGLEVFILLEANIVLFTSARNTLMLFPREKKNRFPS